MRADQDFTDEEMLELWGPREHEAKVVRVGDQVAPIDIPIAELIENVWKLGIKTLFSCHSQWSSHHRTNTIFISFNTVDDFRKFCYHAHNSALDSRIKLAVEQLTGGIVANSWNSIIHNFRENVGFAVSVYIPKYQLEGVNQAFIRALELMSEK